MSNPLKIIIRTNDSTALINGPTKDNQPQLLPCGPTNISQFSHDGSLLCNVTSNSISVIEIPSLNEIFNIELQEILRIAFSPCSTYLVTYVRPRPNKELKHKNIQVWHVMDGKCIWEFHHNKYSADNWPLIHWTDDESAAFVNMNSHIHMYSSSDNFTKINKSLSLKGLDSFVLSPGKKSKIAAYVRELNGAPASVAIYPFDTTPPMPATSTDNNSDKSIKFINKKSFFRVNGIKLLWNSSGTALLCLCYADVDVTNQSYYGEQHLNYLDGMMDNNCQVPNTPEGPIHDVQWSPNGEFFVVVAGFMPAKVLLFNSKCKPLFDLGSGAYNLIRWNPFSRFICVAGFGNLPGDIIFFEKKSNGTCSKIGSTRSPSVTLEWSPDGRYILTAITAPRLRVDNGYKLFNYVGEEISKKCLNELYEAIWIPSPKDNFEDRPISPNKLNQKGTIKNKTSEGKMAYVPPHMRNRSGGNKAPGLNFSLAHSSSRGGRIVEAEPQPSVPGGGFVTSSTSSSSKSKNKKNKNKNSTSSSTSTSTSNSHMTVHNTSTVVKDDKDKRLRALKKKLRQIDALREKMQTNGINSLSDEQFHKLNTEEHIKKQIQELEN